MSAIRSQLSWARFLLATSPGRFLFPLLLAIEISVVFVDGGSWNTEWRWAIDWAGGALYLDAPVIAGAAAWRAQSVRADRGEAMGPYARSSRVCVAEAGGIAAWAVIAHLVLGIGVIISGYVAGLRGLPPATPLLLQSACLIGFAGLGYAVAQLADTRLLPPIVALAVFYGLTAGSLPGLWFEVGGATAPVAGLTYRLNVAFVEIALYTGLALLALALGRTTHGLVWRPAALTLSALTVISSAVWLQSTEPVRFTLTATNQSDYVCKGSAPELCLRPDSTLKQRQIQDVLSKLTKAAGPAAGAPARFVQVTNADRAVAGARQLFINPDAVSSDGVRAEDIAYYFVWNRRCLLGDEPPPPEAGDALYALSGLLLTKAGLDPGDAGRIPPVGALLRWPEDKQRQWVARAMAASEACAFADMPAAP